MDMSCTLQGFWDYWDKLSIMNDLISNDTRNIIPRIANIWCLTANIIFYFHSESIYVSHMCVHQYFGWYSTKKCNQLFVTFLLPKNIKVQITKRSEIHDLPPCVLHMIRIDLFEMKDHMYQAVANYVSKWHYLEY